MKLAVTTATISRKAGGLHISVRFLHQQIAQQVATKVFTLQDEFTKEDCGGWLPLEIQMFAAMGPRSFGFSPSLARAIDLYSPDILHVHGLWQGHALAAFRHSSKAGCPAVISPRGMLDEWAMKRSRWKKNLIGKWFAFEQLKNSKCLHALCDAEANSFRSFGLNNPIALIPNAVSIPKIGSLSHKKNNGKKTLLFLGRLHPKKGLANALRAWKQVIHSSSKIQSSASSDWQFVIAGWDQGGHEADLKRLCDELDLVYQETTASEFITRNQEQGTKNHASYVLFVGPAFGDSKDQLLRQVDACVLPSFSEGLPMAVLEAWAYRLPIIMTDHCNLPEGFQAGAAIRVEPSVIGLSEGLRALFAMSDQEVQTMGIRGRNLVESRFTWPKVASDMNSVYQWVLGGGESPSCVQTS